MHSLPCCEKWCIAPRVPVSKDEEQRRNDQDIDCWAASLAKDKQGRVPKSVFFYKPHDGNGTVKYHVNTYHSKDMHEVRLCVRFPFLNDFILIAMYHASQVSRLLENAAPGGRTPSIEGSSHQPKASSLKSTVTAHFTQINKRESTDT